MGERRCRKNGCNKVRHNAQAPVRNSRAKHIVCGQNKEDVGGSASGVDTAGALTATRRSILRALAAVPTGSALALPNGAISEAWSKFGGGPSDLTFPEEFLGTWVVYNTLTRVSLPQGEDMVSDMNVVDRAQADVGKQQIYPLRFIRNSLGKVVFDRSYNTQMLAEATSGRGVMTSMDWDVDDPNTLRAGIADGRSIFFRVTQRSEEFPKPDRIETSEVAEVVFDTGVPGSQPRVKSNRTFTKWKWRSLKEAGDGPAIVASQTVYDYLTAFDEGFMESRGQAVTEYSYRMAMYPAKAE